MPVNLNGMDPRVLAALRKIQEQARARGIETNIISGVRSYQDQVELAANAAADRAGQPLPYASRGHVSRAAAPGTSPHEEGLAFDLQASDPSRQNELRSLAPSAGLTIISNDPNHFQLGGAGPGRSPSGPIYRTGYAATPTSGRGLLEALQHFESGGRNVPNVHQGTSSGQAQGFDQITTGTWADFGGTRYAPDALHATKEQQDEIASSIPLKRWAPETLNYLRGQGFTLDPNKTLGENIALNGGNVASGAASASPMSGSSFVMPEPPPDDGGLGSLFSSAVQSSTSRPAVQSAPPEMDPLPEIDQSYALASEPADVLGQRYQQNKAARKLSPLGDLFTLPTIGPQAPVASRAPVKPYNMGIG